MTINSSRACCTPQRTVSARAVGYIDAFFDFYVTGSLDEWRTNSITLTSDIHMSVYPAVAAATADAVRRSTPNLTSPQLRENGGQRTAFDACLPPRRGHRLRARQGRLVLLTTRSRCKPGGSVGGSLERRAT